MHSDKHGLLILTYHKITDKPDMDDPLKVSVSNFEKHIRYLKNHYSILTGEQLKDLIQNNEPFPKKSCLITFDDGWLDNYTNAFPILKKYSVPAVIFISTDYIGTDNSFWYDRLSEILIGIKIDGCQFKDTGYSLPSEVEIHLDNITKKPVEKRRPLINDLVEHLKIYSQSEIEYFITVIQRIIRVDEGKNQSSMLTWAQIHEMAEFNISFGSHTKSHAILSQISIEQVAQELEESKKVIEEKIGKPVYFIAYPNGNFNEDIIKIAKKNNYLAGFTCIPGSNTQNDNWFALKRKHVHESLSLGLNGRFSELFYKVELSDLRNQFRRKRIS